MKLHRDQFIECVNEGMTGETEPEPFTPDKWPLFPSKKALKKLKETKTMRFVSCKRFGGKCHSQKPECRKLRGLD